jgi:hypothetical protein
MFQAFSSPSRYGSLDKAEWIIPRTLSCPHSWVPSSILGGINPKLLNYSKTSADAIVHDNSNSNKTRVIISSSLACLFTCPLQWATPLELFELRTERGGDDRPGGSGRLEHSSVSRPMERCGSCRFNGPNLRTLVNKFQPVTP